jgi:hypothetical protein
MNLRLSSLNLTFGNSHKPPAAERHTASPTSNRIQRLPFPSAPQRATRPRPPSGAYLIFALYDPSCERLMLFARLGLAMGGVSFASLYLALRRNNRLYNYQDDLEEMQEHGWALVFRRMHLR